MKEQEEKVKSIYFRLITEWESQKMRIEFLKK